MRLERLAVAAHDRMRDIVAIGPGYGGPSSHRNGGRREREIIDVDLLSGWRTSMARLSKGKQRNHQRVKVRSHDASTSEESLTLSAACGFTTIARVPSTDANCSCGTLSGPGPAAC